MSSSKVILMIFVIFVIFLSDEGVFAKKNKGSSDFCYKLADGDQTQTMSEKVLLAVFILFGGLCIVLFELRFNIHTRRNY
jgi:hypothetical protein